MRSVKGAVNAVPAGKAWEQVRNVVQYMVSLFILRVTDPAPEFALRSYINADLYDIVEGKNER